MKSGMQNKGTDNKNRDKGDFFFHNKTTFEMVYSRAIPLSRLYNLVLIK